MLLADGTVPQALFKRNHLGEVVDCDDDAAEAER
jgi:hypothetical protein